MNDNDITSILIDHFGTEKTLQEVGKDYEALQEMIERERSSNGERSRRLAALQILARIQLQVVLRRLVETPNEGGESIIPTK